jgi:hypothetical protein
MSIGPDVQAFMGGVGVGLAAGFTVVLLLAGVNVIRRFLS